MPASRPQSRGINVHFSQESCNVPCLLHFDCIGHHNHSGYWQYSYTKHPKPTNKASTTMASTETKRNKGIRRSWLAIGLVTTTIHSVGASIATATISRDQIKSEPSIWTKTPEERSAIRRQRRTRIAEIRGLGTINEQRDYESMLENESFEIMFRDFNMMSLVTVRKRYRRIILPYIFV